MMTRLIPNSAKTVKAYGKKSETSLSDEYDPEPDSGRRERFSAELEQMADTDRQAILDTADVRL